MAAPVPGPLLLLREARTLAQGPQYILSEDVKKPPSKEGSFYLHVLNSFLKEWRRGWDSNP
ncbi:hypothetical protein, partial [Paenibacillus riograndensis]|uniref:hypothetical protein n=1 Tax=Paenibacillus riograndensis TaxID=483937 RepID=UPI000585382D